MQKKFDTAIFDLDGTLLNTLDDLADSVNLALSNLGYPQRTLEEIRNFVGNGADMLISRSLAPITDKEKHSAALAEFKKIYAKNMQNKTRPYDGILEMLATLSENGIKMAVVSNKHHQAVVPLIEHYYGKYIHVAIGTDAATPEKPDPTGTLKAIEALGSDINRCIYMGDSDVDIATGHNAKLFSIGCLWGFRDREVLQKAGADMIIASPNELIKVFGI